MKILVSNYKKNCKQIKQIINYNVMYMLTVSPHNSIHNINFKKLFL